MKLKQHLEIGNAVLQSDVLDMVNINSTAFLLGNIAPDLNCVYPAHRLKTTEKRFYKRLRIAEKSEISVVKSFMLGIVTHYICDYFCYAHNIESLGVPHKKYERNLYNYYEAHIDEVNAEHKNLEEIWVKAKAGSIKKYLGDGCMDTDLHCEFIVNQIKYMNDKYMNSSNDSEKVDWTSNSSQIKKDLEYTAFMIRHILTLTVEPFKCFVGDY